jgi:dihydroxy-acid dehydratase
LPRNQGLKGGPAMGGSASLVLFALNCRRSCQDHRVRHRRPALGPVPQGLTVAEVSPEAATGGPIGKVRDGDTIRISVANRSIDIEVPAEDMAARQGVGYVTEASGYLANFRETVRPLDTGGVLLPPSV